MNWDSYVLNERELHYQEIRKNTFIRMYQKHLNKHCDCVKNGKICNVNSINLVDVFMLYDHGILDGWYNIMQSITQSLRCTTGKKLERIIEYILRENHISFKSQVLVDGHVVDFVVYDKNRIHTIISCKNTLRERKFQDKHLTNVVIITTDDSTDSNIITINKVDKNLTRFINKLPKQSIADWWIDSDDELT